MIRSIFIYIGLLGLLLSCQNEDPNETIDLINVVRNGATIPAYIYGNVSSETFIILLHGGPGGNALEYRGGITTDRLEQEYAMVYTEQRGQGMSQGAFSSDEFSTSEMAKDVHALAQSLFIKYGDDISLFLMGHSWGGMLGSQVMIDSEFAKSFKGWIDVDGAHNLPLTFKSTVRRLDSLAEDQLFLGNSPDYWQEVKMTLSEIDTSTTNFSDDFSRVNREAFSAEAQLEQDRIIDESDLSSILPALNNIFFINNSITTFFNGTIANSTLFQNGLLNYSLSDELHKITTPSLILWGRFDAVVSTELAFEALNKIGTEDKELIIFERSGHSPMNNEPEAFVDAVTEFVERLK